MKKLLLLFIFLSYSTKSQVVFLSPGAEWNFSCAMSDFMNPGYENENIKYTRDSILGIDTVKVLTHSRFFVSHTLKGYGPTLIKQNGDTLFFRNRIATANNWEILYNLSAQPGHSWTTNIVTPSWQGTTIITYTTLVNTVTQTTINNTPLKQLFVTQISKQNGFVATNPFSVKFNITERIGASTFLFPFYDFSVSDGPYIAGMLCYQDSNFGLKKFTSFNCNYNTVGLNELMPQLSPAESLDLRVAPNPAHDVVEVCILNTENKTYLLRISNVSGRVIEEKNVEGKTRIETEDYSAGVYFICIFGNNQAVASRKLIIER